MIRYSSYRLECLPAAVKREVVSFSHDGEIEKAVLLQAIGRIRNHARRNRALAGFGLNECPACPDGVMRGGCTKRCDKCGFSVGCGDG